VVCPSPSVLANRHFHVRPNLSTTNFFLRLKEKKYSPEIILFDLVTGENERSSEVQFPRYSSATSLVACNIQTMATNGFPSWGHAGSTSSLAPARRPAGLPHARTRTCMLLMSAPCVGVY
jgi:hypothetical protein